jgi:ELWxxDGT repeat protein
MKAIARCVRAAALATAAACAASAAIAPVRAAEPPILRVGLVRDLDATPGPQGSNPVGFVTWNGRAYFSATTAASGTELFRSDGTAAGTQLVRDFGPGPATSGARPVGVANGRLVVEAEDGMVGRQLWALADAASAPVRLTALATTGVDFRRFGEVGGRLLMKPSAFSGAGPLWSTDGTAAGTVNLRPAFTDGYVQMLAGPPCVLGGAGVFAIRDSGGLGRLMRSDGTVAGTYAIARTADDVRPEYVFSRELNGQCQFLLGTSSDEWALWTTQGSNALTARVLTGSGRPRGIVAIGGVLHLAIENGARYQLLRNVPGTTQFVLTVDVPGVYASTEPVEVPAGVGFGLTFDDGGVARVGAWLGDGTAAGTRRVYPTPGATTVLPYPYDGLVVVNDAIVFQSNTGGMRIDGATGAASSAPAQNVFDFHDAAVAGALRIGAGASAVGVEPWASDGSAGNTRLVVDLMAATGDGLGGVDAQAPTLASAAGGNVLFFTQPTSSYRFSLWRTDGSEAGTRRLPAALQQNNSAQSPVASGDGVVFHDVDAGGSRAAVVRATPALDAVETLSTAAVNTRPASTGPGAVFLAYGTVGWDLYGSAGASPGSLIWPAFGGTDVGPTRPDVVPIGHVGGAAIFFGGSPRAVWRSDGTAPGTFALAATGDLPLGDAHPSIVAGGRLYFVNCASSRVCALVATDGSVAGTASLRDVAGGATEYPSKPGAFALAGSRVVFVAQNVLWASDGTPGGTDSLLSFATQAAGAPVASAGAYAHLSLGCVDWMTCKYRYVVSDGTSAGTRYVEAPPGIEPVLGVMAPVGGAVVFSCSTPDTGVELCTAGGDGGDLRFLADIRPGPAGSDARLLGVTGNAVYLKANDGTHGFEPWRVLAPGDAIFASGFDSPSTTR